jgi:hypothetical protein
MEAAQDYGVCLKLWREEGAKGRQGNRRIEVFGVRGLEVYDPPGIFPFGQRFEPCTKDAIHAN